MPDARGGELSGQQAGNQHHNQLNGNWTASNMFSTFLYFFRLFTESHVCISICIHLSNLIIHHNIIYEYTYMIHDVTIHWAHFLPAAWAWNSICLRDVGSHHVSPSLRLDEAALAPLAALPALRVLNISRQSEPTCFFVGTYLNCLLVFLQESCPRPFSFGLSSLPMFGTMGLVLMWKQYGKPCLGRVLKFFESLSRALMTARLLRSLHRGTLSLHSRSFPIFWVLQTYYVSYRIIYI